MTNTDTVGTGARLLHPKLNDAGIIAIGDSITAACSGDLCVDGIPSRSWAQWIASASGRPLVVHAQPGARSSDIVRILPSESPKAAVVLIHVGTNDVLSSRTWVETDFRANFHRILAAASASGGAVVVLQLPVSLGRGARYLVYGPLLAQRVSRARLAIRELAAGSGAVIVEPPTWKDNDLWLDGVHPTSSGHRALADEVLPLLGLADGTRNLDVEPASLRSDYRSWKNKARVRFLTVQPIRSWGAHFLGIAARVTGRLAP